ncbi:MAG: SLBB domain-containing protein, partial [Candidatus Sumerlaeia bacterium]|nr:SLBB domain-containing protein [Candidatus Sumerlaeia bacterium]
RQCEIFIANGAECEPLLQSDQQTMIHFADEVVAGLQIAMAVTGAKRGIIAVKEKYHQAVSAIEQAINRLSFSQEVKLHLLPDFYPAGDEQVLVYETTQRIVPESGLPLDVGCIVNNVTTLRQIFYAVQGIPVTHRLVTVIGEVYKPRVLNLPVGTPINEVIKLCGGATVDDYVVIDGGPMMGRLAPIAVRKTTTGLIVLPATHRLVEQLSYDNIMQRLRTLSICDQCFACTEVCPRYQLGHRLEAHLVMRDVCNGIKVEGNRQQAIGRGQSVKRITDFLQIAYLCCHCDLCRVWGCPVELAPGRVMAVLKDELRQQNIVNPFRERQLGVRSSRNGIRPPVSSLIWRLGLQKYYHPVSLQPEPADVPLVRLELHQHIGRPCRPVVKIGDNVKAGQIVADVSADELGCPLHSPFNGIITSITSQWIEIQKKNMKQF